MARMLFIAAGPQLLASLAEQFNALGGYAARPVDTENFHIQKDVGHDAAMIVDAAFCDAPAFVRRLRMEGFAGTIVLVGAASADADATITRPFRFANLLALLGARRKIPNPEEDFGVRLTEKEAAILARLAQARGAIIPKSALLADVWGYGPNVSTRTLETHIHRLRRKIEDDPRRPTKLLTEEGGYRLAKSTT